MANPKDSSVRFVDVVARYAHRTRNAIDGVSFDVRPGLITAVVGPNGSGKSTLVRLLLRRIAAAHGSVEINGHDARTLDARSLALSVAVVPQREEPSSALLVREFVGFGRHAHRGLFSSLRAIDRDAIERAMHRAGVLGEASQRIDELSGGEWQRVRIARALAQETSILVLDEPTTFLDIAHEMAVFELVDELARDGRTVLLVSHQLNLVARFAGHIVLLSEGRVAAAGTAPDVMRGETLERVYQWPLVVTRDAAVGAPMLVPLRGTGLVSRGAGK